MTSHDMLVGYAGDFVSFLVSGKYLDGYTVRNIILYGSVARGDFTKESDIDIFVDVLNPDNVLSERMKKSVEEFTASIWFSKWKRFGIKNNISCLSGKLEQWKELRRSIISDGIVLYGKYSPQTRGEHVTMFLLEKIKPEKKRVLMSRKLFGYTKFGKYYKGTVERLEGEKLSSGCFIVPIQFSGTIAKLLKEKKVTFRIKEFASV